MEGPTKPCGLGAKALLDKDLHPECLGTQGWLRVHSLNPGANSNAPFSEQLTALMKTCVRNPQG